MNLFSRLQNDCNTFGLILICEIIFLSSTITETRAADPVQAMIITLNDQAELTVDATRLRTYRTPESVQAMVVWNDVQTEAWTILEPEQLWTKPVNLTRRSNQFANAANRSSGKERSPGSGIGLQSNIIDQLRGRIIYRNGSNDFLTPHNGFLLTSQLTIRRMAKEGQNSYPENTAEISQRNQLLLRILLPEGQAVIKWSEIADLPPNLKAGLPVGEYELAIQGQPQRVHFTIVDENVRSYIDAQLHRLDEQLKSAPKSLYLELATQTLLHQPEISGYLGEQQPIAFPADVLDLLDQFPDHKLTAHLKEVRQSVCNQLQQVETKQKAEAQVTGINKIDTARSLMLSGEWEEALELLKDPELQNEPRSHGLALLYQASVLSEFSASQASEVSRLYQQAIALLASSSNFSDQFRAHNNFAGFLLNHTIDCVHNHAFRIITGEKNPLFTALYHWKLAEHHFLKASQLAQQMDQNDRVAVSLNRARLCLVLADIIFTMDVEEGGQRKFQQAETAAYDQSDRILSELDQIMDSSKLEPVLLASIYELKAEISFKRNGQSQAFEFAQKSQLAYLEDGSLMGVESIQRMLSSIALHANDSKHNPEQVDAAISHLKVSQVISEFLEHRVPDDMMGQSQAGFHARRAYVSQQLSELLANQGQHKAALEYLETAKAGALRQALMTSRISTDGLNQQEIGLESILENWPAEQSALVYRIGPSVVHVFLVDSSGQVISTVVRDSHGQSVTPGQLVFLVQDCLQSIEGESERMRLRIERNNGFDHSWQQKLSTLYEMLIPQSVRPALTNSKTVVIVPHHILHYLPFAALVQEMDRTQNGPYNVPRPRFLIDGPFDLLYAPSLTSWAILGQTPLPPIQNVRAMGIQQFADAPALPGVSQELANLKSAFKERVRQVVLDENADRKTMQQLMARPGLLLLATHGMNEPDQPLNSHLLCYRDQEQLTARDIYESSVNANIIILSACYSGLADRSPLPGDDLFGLQRALLQNGGQVVISGQWDVFDGTAPVILQDVFEQMASSHKPSSALAFAQRKFLNNLRKSDQIELYLHPYFWAMYTVSGNDR